MFTLQQIKTAHSKVRSGADFPGYIHEIRGYGLKRYIFSVIDGSTIYYGENGYEVAAAAIYEPKTIHSEPSPGTLRQNIAIHQQGQTDFFTFCDQAANAGVRQWIIDTTRMLCIYEDSEGRQMVAEPIPDAG